MNTATTSLHLRSVTMREASLASRNPTVVFLHGIGDSAETWQPVLNAWPDDLDVKVVALDLPGHGGSDWMEPGEYSVRSMADAVTTTLEQNQIDRPILIGHSLGARVALDMAAGGEIAPVMTVLVDLNPDPNEDSPTDAQLSIADHIDALITGASNEDEFIGILRNRLPLADPAVLEDVTRAQLAVKPLKTSARVALPLDPELINMLTSVRSVDAWPLLEDAMCPIAFIRGEFSGILDRSTAMKMKDAVMRCVGDETVRRAGHAIALEQPVGLANGLARIVRNRLSALS